MFGHHHYTYAYDKNNGNAIDKNKDLNPDDLVTRAKKYYNKLHSIDSSQPVVPTFVW